jgi:hypothetical protein
MKVPGVLHLDNVITDVIGGFQKLLQEINQGRGFLPCLLAAEAHLHLVRFSLRLTQPEINRGAGRPERPLMSTVWWYKN